MGICKLSTLRLLWRLIKSTTQPNETTTSEFFFNKEIEVEEIQQAMHGKNEEKLGAKL